MSALSLSPLCTFTAVQVLRHRRGLDTLKPIMEVTSQLIGLIAGVIVFCCTVVVTFLLLIFGGSFKRMREQVTQQSRAVRTSSRGTAKPPSCFGWVSVVVGSRSLNTNGKPRLACSKLALGCCRYSRPY